VCFVCGLAPALSFRVRARRLLLCPPPPFPSLFPVCCQVFVGGDEEVAFWCLVALVEDLRDRDFYATPPAAMNGLLAETEVQSTSMSCQPSLCVTPLP
jgi:hypothetical protein